MSNQVKTYLLSSFLIFLTYSCDKEESLSLNTQNQIDENEHFVSLDEAQTIISQVLFETPIKGTQSKGNISLKRNKKIKKSKSFPDKSGKAAGHIINFEEGGWVIISGDKRTEALLAFSSESEFELNLDNVPPGPKEWLSLVSEVITEIRSGKIKSEDETSKYQGSWEISEIENALAEVKSNLYSKTVQQSSTECYYPGYPVGCTSICQDTYYTKGPLLGNQTTGINWGQGTGYNDLLPLKSCAGATNGRALVGCGAVAMGQIMMYHKQPSPSYNFTAMSNTSGTAESRRLLRDIGITVNMHYWCSGSWLFPNVLDGGMSAYSYSGAIFESYDPGDQNKVKSDLGKNQPVIFVGKDSPLYNFSGVWHIWVCDGYKTRYDCQNGIGYLYFHMNWGWESNHNGYYGFQNWVVDGDVLNHRQRLVHNIKP